MEDIIRLKSGTEIYANRQILGIDPRLSIFQGYDGNITYSNNYGYWTFLTLDELTELADIAIARWTRLKEKITNGELDFKHS